MEEDFGILGLIETSFLQEELFTKKKESIQVLFGDQSALFSKFPIWLFTFLTTVRNSNQAKKTI
jgi:hypothetical protein